MSCEDEDEEDDLMLDSDYARVLSALTATAEILGEPMTEGRLRGYFIALRDLPAAAILEALGRITATRTSGSTRFPLPGDIRAEIVGTPDSRAQAAWLRLERAAIDIGPWQSVTFADPVLHVAIRQAGGWPSVCDWFRLDEKQLGFRRHHFLETYRTLAQRGAGRADDRHLPGIAEATNAETRVHWTHGLGHQDPVIEIDGEGRRALPPGDEQKALME